MLKGSIDIFWSSLTLILLALIFSIGELYLIATYARFDIWAKTDEYKSMSFDIANVVLSNKKFAEENIVLYAKRMDEYDEKKIPDLDLCEVDYSILVKDKKNQWVFRSYDKNSPFINEMSPIDHIDVPVLILYEGTYSNKRIVIPGTMEVALFSNVYKKIACRTRATLLSKNETFSIGCINESKNICHVVITKRYGENGPFHVCFDKNCQKCIEVPKDVYDHIKPSSDINGCEQVFDEKYYNFPGSGIMKINITDGYFNFDVYKKINSMGGGGGSSAG